MDQFWSARIIYEFAKQKTYFLILKVLMQSDQKDTEMISYTRAKLEEAVICLIERH